MNRHLSTAEAQATAPGGRERLRTEIAEAGLPTPRSAVNRVIAKQIIGNAGLTGAPVALTI